MISGFYILMCTKNKFKLNLQNNTFNTTIASGELCKIEKDMIIRTVGNII